MKKILKKLKQIFCFHQYKSDRYIINSGYIKGLGFFGCSAAFCDRCGKKLISYYEDVELETHYK